MNQTIEEKNKELVLKAFDTLFSETTQRPSATGRPATSSTVPISSLVVTAFKLIKSIPPTLKYEPGTIVAEKDFVIVHGRFSGIGLPVNWIAADIVRIKDGVLVEHWDVIEDEVTRERSKSGHPMFGDTFPK
jgi:predicted SnoaL-like aldol condensation-catalyzing enzyme